MGELINWKGISTAINEDLPVTSIGSVEQTNGTLVSARIPQAAVGDYCELTARKKVIPAQVVSFSKDTVLIAPYERIDGLKPGAKLTCFGHSPRINLPENPRGLVLDALGTPLRQLGSSNFVEAELQAVPPSALSRAPIRERFPTGIRSIDSLIPLGYGQRLGLFAGAGVGKSTLLACIAREAEVDAVVVALVGERGREVNEFIESALGPDGLKKSIVVASTSDESAIRRWYATLTATAVAERFRAEGKKVLLLVDSLTRVARAIRELSLAAGEIPVRQGYTPAVYSELPRLLERAGNDSKGSITAIYTMLSHDEDEADPLVEEVKSILDGHIVLTREFVERGIRPAIDAAQSISRVSTEVSEEDEQEALAPLKRAITTLSRDRDIILFGGTPSPALAAALKMEDEINCFLSQKPHEAADYGETINWAKELASKYKKLEEKFKNGE